MREWRIKAHNVSKWRMEELRAVCRQYQAMLKGTQAQKEKAEKIREAAEKTQGGGWEKALIENCCIGKRYEQLDGASMPTSNRNAFFAARREFFRRLDDEMG